MKMNFNVTPEQDKAVQRIVDRAVALGIYDNFGMPKLTARMDIIACHNHACPLKLAEFADADDQNFAHDAAGIARHMNRRTAELEDCFTPRFNDLPRKGDA